MVRRLFGSESLHKPVLISCKWDPDEQAAIRFETQGFIQSI